MPGLLARLGHWLGDRHHHPDPAAALPTGRTVPAVVARIHPMILDAKVIRCPRCKSTAGRVVVGFEIDDQAADTVYALAGCSSCGWHRRH